MGSTAEICAALHAVAVIEHLSQVSVGNLASLDGVLNPAHSTINVRRPLLLK